MAFHIRFLRRVFEKNSSLNLPWVIQQGILRRHYVSDYVAMTLSECVKMKLGGDVYHQRNSNVANIRREDVTYLRRYYTIKPCHTDVSKLRGEDITKGGHHCSISSLHRIYVDPISVITSLGCCLYVLKYNGEAT